MPDVTIRLADNDSDIDSAKALCLNWLDWHWQHYADDWPRGADHPMHPDAFRAVVANLPVLHARPRGGILLASVDGQDVGCVMFHDAGSNRAEFKRIFVSDGGRGHGVGTKLLEALFTQLRADGNDSVFLSSATFLTHARHMYQAAGFTDMPLPAGFLAAWRDRVYFMQKSLR